MTALTARLWDGLRARIPGVARHGATAGPRLPNTLNIRIPGCAGESLLVLLDLAGVAVSLGSACAAGAAEPSHVLHAMGLGDDAARSALRLSLGPATTEAEIDAVIDLLPRLVRDVRARGRAGVAA
jgi:cysteine desulfurase